MRLKIRILFDKITNSDLFKDSFWAIFGNGLGTGLMLLAGIVIARFLGKDLYGEYGVVKTNMFYLAGLSTFGLGFTSTRFIAKYITEEVSIVYGIAKTALAITLGFSCLIAMIMVIFAESLSTILNEPILAEAFRILAVIVVIRALITTLTGILAGIRAFKIIAVNSILSGFIMTICAILLTYYYGLDGAYASLVISQISNFILNLTALKKEMQKYNQTRNSFDSWRLIKFSFPVALQEISYSICGWLGILALTKYSSLGEVGIYSATAQWNAVILFIPGLLTNVLLSHLSRRSGNQEQRKKIMVLLSTYLVCTLIPFLLVYILTDFIVSFYGSQFVGMGTVLRVLIFATIPICCSNVFKSELLASGHPWILFTLRFIKDIIFLGLLVYLLIHLPSVGGALIYAWVNIGVSTFLFVAFYIAYLVLNSRHNETLSNTDIV